MKTSELELPQHLNTETRSPGGAMTRLIVPDKLVAWAEEAHGDAVVSLCRTVFEKKLANISAWENDRIQQLHDEWMVAGNDEDISGSKYVNVKHYHTTREAVAREADLKRASVRERMPEHQTAIEELVQEARVFIRGYAAQQDENETHTYMLVIVVIAAVCYALIN